MIAEPLLPVVRILYADDNVDHLDLFRQSLKGLRWKSEVLSALSGKEAVAMLAREAVDLVVIDYRLPDCSGLDLMKQISGPGRPPVVMITGAGDEKIAVSAMKLGAYDYVVKDDLIGQELPKAVESALERSTAARRQDEERARLTEMAFTDALTGLRNRRFFNESFEREFASARRHGRRLALILVDFDHFKVVNDTHGHAIGDRVLCESARALATLVRSSDLMARYGGEEFVALLPDTDPAGAKILGERMRRTVAALEFGDPSIGQVRVTLSLGLANLGSTVEYDGPSEFLSAADAALYRAKHLGRDRLVVAEESQVEGAPPA